MGIITGSATVDAILGYLLLGGILFSGFGLLLAASLAAWQVFRNLK